jgi:methionyl-tRNA synthetase
LVNGFLNINGQKISKSIGNVIRPSEWVRKYGADAVRYYLLRYTSITEDSDISEEKLLQAYNSDLANGLGNLVARVAKLCEKNNISFNEGEEKFSDIIVANLRSYSFNVALTNIWGKISLTDAIINKEEPWKISDQKILKEKLYIYAKNISEIAYDIKPFLPDVAEKIEEQFKGPKIISGKPLFPRI